MTTSTGSKDKLALFPWDLIPVLLVCGVKAWGKAKAVGDTRLRIGSRRRWIQLLTLHHEAASACRGMPAGDGRGATKTCLLLLLMSSISAV